MDTQQSEDNLVQLLKYGKCQSCNKSIGEEEHTCPFAEDIHGDYTSMCNCCDGCAGECADSI